MPAALLGFRKDDTPDAYGVTAPKKGEAHRWVFEYDEVCRVPWTAILALPALPR